MFPFWEVAVAPALRAAEARRVVEIGALRGEQTRLVVDHLGPDAELHVIDPLPDFDPAEHEREFPGRYVFHRALSLDVLGDLPPMDAALVDGDHNWYTVVNELRMLRRVARDAGAPLPLLLLHDVGWPYGRRDLYYDPDTVPAEHRQDWRRAGMEPGKVRLVPYGKGLNPTLANAKVEGGRRNGVMTGLEDFLAEHDRPVRTVVLPIYFGLAIVAEEERLARQPELAALLDHLEGPRGKDELLALAEQVRLEGLMFQHRIFYEREESVDRLSRRYVGQLRARIEGAHGADPTLEQVEAAIDAVEAEHTRGDVVCVGCARPGAATVAAAVLDSRPLARRVVVVDGDGDGTGSAVAHALAAYDVPDGRVATAAGPPDDLPDAVAVLVVGPGLAADDAVLDGLATRLAHGAQVVAEAGLDALPARLLVELGTRAAPVPADGPPTRWRVSEAPAPAAAS